MKTRQARAIRTGINLAHKPATPHLILEAMRSNNLTWRAYQRTHIWALVKKLYPANYPKEN